MSQPTSDHVGPVGPRPGPDLGLDTSGGRRAGFIRRVVARVAWPVLREQVTFNHLLADEVRALRVVLGEQQADSLARDAGPAVAELRSQLAVLAARVEDLAGRVEHQGWTIDAAVPKLDAQGYAVDALTPLVERHGADIDAARSLLSQLQDAARELGATLEHQGWAIEAAVPKLEEHGYALASLEEALDGLHSELDLVDRQSFARYHDGIGAIRTEIGELAARVEVGADEVAASLAARGAAAEELESRLEATEQAFERELAALRIRLAQVDLVLGRIREALPAIPDRAGLASVPGAVEHLWAAFADACGELASRAETRAAAYLADVLSTGSTKPVLDIGAGRGEWLEWLRKAGLDAHGVEGDVSWAGGAPAVGVVVGDVVEHLRGLGRSSLGAITAARVVGYLPAGELVELLDLAAIAIEPGGALVIDMSDPVGAAAGVEPAVAVSSSSRHVGHAFLAFAVAARGFVDVELRQFPFRGGDATRAGGAYALVARRP